MVGPCVRGDFYVVYYYDNFIPVDLLLDLRVTNIDRGRKISSGRTKQEDDIFTTVPLFPVK